MNLCGALFPDNAATSFCFLRPPASSGVPSPRSHGTSPQSGGAVSAAPAPRCCRRRHGGASPTGRRRRRRRTTPRGNGSDYLPAAISAAVSRPFTPRRRRRRPVRDPFPGAAAPPIRLGQCPRQICPLPPGQTARRWSCRRVPPCDRACPHSRPGRARDRSARRLPSASDERLAADRR